jgi:DNA-binding response OmpR family regulator
MTHKVLVVDDFEPIQNLFKDVLERFNFDVITADNGEDGLRSIYTEQPDMLVLDVDLPRMSGLELLARIRSNEITKNIRVIIVTANHIIEHSDDISDADLVLIKPVSPLDLANFAGRLISSQSRFDNIIN